MWKYLEQQSTHLMQCERVKKTRAHGNNGNTQLIKEYGIEKRSPMTQQHVLAVLIWCNVPEIQTAFLESFELDPSLMDQEEEDSSGLDPGYGDLINQHAHYANLARLLRECAEIFGQCLRSSDRLYHVVRGQYLYHDAVMTFCPPMACTSQYNVACAVSMWDNQVNGYDDRGLIVQMSRYNM